MELIERLHGHSPELTYKTTRRSTWRPSTWFVCVLSILVLAMESPAETKEFWISSNPNPSGLGTLASPFDGSTAENFDYWMNSVPENSTIHILAGKYQTQGCNLPTTWLVKSGQKILGSGMDNTVIQLKPNAADFSWVIQQKFSCTNIEISDLTCDANYTSGAYTYNGIALGGTKMAVRRVKVINIAKKSFVEGNYECWGICVSNSGEGTPVEHSDGNIIEECEVSHYKGGSEYGTVTAIAMGCAVAPGREHHYISGVIRNNRVFLPTGDGIAINGGNTANTLIEGNYVEGSYHAFYGDTGTYDKLTVVDNFFKDCVMGVTLLYQPRHNLTFANNTIRLTSSRGDGNRNAAFFFAHKQSGLVSTNITIIGNNLGIEGIPEPGVTYFSVLAYQVAGLQIANNTMESPLYCWVWGNGTPSETCTGVNMFNNVSSTGGLPVDPNNNNSLMPDYQGHDNQIATANGVLTVRGTVLTDGSGKLNDSALNIVSSSKGGLGLDLSTWASGLFPYTTSTGVFAPTPITSFARSLLDDGDATSARVTLGVSETHDGFADAANSTAHTKYLRNDVDGSMNGKGISNLKDPAQPQDAATKQYVDNQKSAAGSAASAYVGTSQSIPINTVTIIRLNTEEFDLGNALDTTTFTYTVPATGTYLLTGSVQILSLANGKQCSLYVYRNNASIIMDGVHKAYSSGSAANYFLKVNKIVSLASGDQVTLRIYHNDTVARTVEAGSDKSFLSITRIQ